MFDTAFIMIDEAARPIIIIPEHLPQGQTALNIVPSGMDILVDNRTIGAVRDMDEQTLALIGLQDKVGMATLQGEGAPMPETIQYVATVTDTREG